MSVRAKFRVQTISRQMGVRPVVADGATRYEDCELRTVTLTPVTGTKGENATFWQATPSGKIELSMVLASAVEQFDLGREMYVTFEPSDEAE